MLKSLDGESTGEDHLACRSIDHSLFLGDLQLISNFEQIAARCSISYRPALILTCQTAQARDGLGLIVDDPGVVIIASGRRLKVMDVDMEGVGLPARIILIRWASLNPLRTEAEQRMLRDVSLRRTDRL